MKKTSVVQRILHELDFNERWFDLEFVSSETLKELWTDFQNGEDTNKEHYRWRAFTHYLKISKEIDGNNLRELYQLGEIDADYSMGIAIQVEILQRKDCPVDLINKALNSDEKTLVKVARRKLGLEYK